MYIVVSWWCWGKKGVIAFPVITFHRSEKKARKDKEERQKRLGKRAKVILAKIIK